MLHQYCIFICLSLFLNKCNSFEQASFGQAFVNYAVVPVLQAALWPRSDSCRHTGAQRVNEKINSLKPHITQIFMHKNVPRYVEPGLSPATDTPVSVRTSCSIFWTSAVLPSFCGSSRASILRSAARSSAGTPVRSREWKLQQRIVLRGACFSVQS